MSVGLPVDPEAQDAGERVLREHTANPRRECDRCGRRFQPKRRHQKYCEDACRLADWHARQADLPLEPPARPLPPVVDQRVPPAEQRRLCRMSRLILERLRKGQASNADLAAMFGPGAAWRTRVRDVRQYLRGQGETVTSRQLVEGLWVYEIGAAK